MLHIWLQDFCCTVYIHPASTSPFINTLILKLCHLSKPALLRSWTNYWDQWSRTGKIPQSRASFEQVGVFLTKDSVRHSQQNKWKEETVWTVLLYPEILTRICTCTLVQYVISLICLWKPSNFPLNQKSQNHKILWGMNLELCLPSMRKLQWGHTARVEWTSNSRPVLWVCSEDSELPSHHSPSPPASPLTAQGT